jgi:hypothetical protein
MWSGLRPRLGRLATSILLLFIGSDASLGALARQDQPHASNAIIQGDVSTQNGTIAIGGAVVVLALADREVGRTSSQGDGRFRFDGLAPGEYTVTATLEGFQPRRSVVRLANGQTADLRLNLDLAETVHVTPAAERAALLPSSGTVAAADSVSNEEIEQLTSGGGLPSALRLLASVIEVPGGVSIKGGRPNQASVQIGPGLFVDPATGLTQGTLPDDAIEAVTVLPNPYAVEFGRFSSGLVVIQTRRAAKSWKTRLGNLDPSFRTKRGEPFNVEGIASFGPRMEIGGPIVKDRLLIHQSVQYRYEATDVPSRPQDQVRTSHRFGSFTRLDANLSDSHSLIVVGGLSPTRSENATLGTFIPPPATVNIHSDVDTMAATERTIWSDTLFSETTFEINRFAIDVLPQGSAPMELLPQQTLGNFYNRQDRSAISFQAIHTLSGTSQSRFGLNMFKAGVDVVLSAFDAMSESRSILIRRSNGTLARRLEFTPRAAPSIDSTDLAIFAQDRVQPNSRWYLEFGARVDRDGVIDRFNVTPRVGSAVLLNESGTSVVRGGFGLFYERTPSTVGVFQQLEVATETRFAENGTTPLGPPQVFTHTMEGPLRTPRSHTWDASFDHRFSRRWAIRVSGLDRRGSREYILDRVVDGPEAELALTSAGSSRYRELEVGIHFTAGTGLDVKTSYVRSQASADLNAFTFFYDSVQTPVLGDNAYGPARADVPHRLLTRWRAMPTPTWLVAGLLDWRTGLPYSVVDGALDYVGPRNGERFPTYFRLDVGVEHRFKIFNLRPWIGVRVDNLLNSFNPTDVQANLTSPSFGSFYNSAYRQVRLQLRFGR